MMVFAAKEALFKALYPLERVWFGFQAASLRWDDGAGRFTAALKEPVAAAWPAGATLPIRCEVHGELVVAAAVVPA